LSTQAGQLLLLGLAFIAWTSYQRFDATQDCQDEQLLADLAESNRQLQIANDIAAEARARADEVETAMTELRELADGLTEEIAEGDGCAIDPDMADRLRAIR
jgi:hypothetical protein